MSTQPVQPAAESTESPAEAREVEQQLAQIVAGLPDDVALEVLHFAEYMAMRTVAGTKTADERWDALFAATTDRQWDVLIAHWTQGDETGIAIKDDELVPVPISDRIGE